MRNSAPHDCCAGQLHNVRIKLICNKHLAKLGVDLLELHRYIAVPARYFKWDAGHALPVRIETDEAFDECLSMKPARHFGCPYIPRRDEHVHLEMLLCVQ